MPTFLEQFIVDSVNGKLTRQGQGLGVLGVEGMLPRHAEDSGKRKTGQRGIARGRGYGKQMLRVSLAVTVNGNPPCPKRFLALTVMAT